LSDRPKASSPNLATANLTLDPLGSSPNHLITTYARRQPPTWPHSRLARLQPLFRRNHGLGPARALPHLCNYSRRTQKCTRGNWLLAPFGEMGAKINRLASGEPTANGAPMNCHVP
jgi:hypothetical protein